MKLYDFFLWAFRQCQKRLLESFLIIIAIGLGVGVIVSVLALFDGVRGEQDEYLSQHYYRTIRITSTQDVSALFAEATGPLVSIPQVVTGEQVQLTIDDMYMLQEALPYAYVYVEQPSTYPTELLLEDQTSNANQGGSNIMNIFGSIMRQFGANIQVNLTTPDFFKFMGFELERGDVLNELDLERGTHVIVLGSELAERLFGTDDPIGKTVPLGMDGTQYTVIGVLSSYQTSTSQSIDTTPVTRAQNYNIQAFIPLTAQPAAGITQAMGRVAERVSFPQMQALPIVGALTAPSNVELRVGLPHGQDLGRALREVRDYVYLTYGDTVSIYAPYEVFQRQQRQFALMGIVIALFSSIGLVIASLNILNLMMARILRRTRCIGISMAIGASRRNVFFQFIVEALFMGIVGCIIGIAFSYGGIKIVAAIINQPVYPSIPAQMMGITLALITSLLFGVYPAYQASRIEPIEALRTE